MAEVVYTSDAPAPIGPYSQAIRQGDFVFVSGQLAIDPRTGVYRATDVATETELALRNLGSVLRAAGLDFAQVVKTSIFLQSMEDFPVVNEVYARCFAGTTSHPAPARETVAVAALPLGAKVEISCIAAIGQAVIGQ